MVVRFVDIDINVDHQLSFNNHFCCVCMLSTIGSRTLFVLTCYLQNNTNRHLCTSRKTSDNSVNGNANDLFMNSMFVDCIGVGDVRIAYWKKHKNKRSTTLSLVTE